MSDEARILVLTVEVERLRQENDRLRAENAELRPLVSDLRHKVRLRERHHDTEYPPTPVGPHAERIQTHG